MIRYYVITHIQLSVHNSNALVLMSSSTRKGKMGSADQADTVLVKMNRDPLTLTKNIQVGHIHCLCRLACMHTHTHTYIYTTASDVEASHWTEVQPSFLRHFSSSVLYLLKPNLGNQRFTVNQKNFLLKIIFQPCKAMRTNFVKYLAQQTNKTKRILQCDK